MSKKLNQRSTTGENQSARTCVWSIIGVVALAAAAAALIANLPDIKRFIKIHTM
jgi:hypothetical protein